MQTAEPDAAPTPGMWARLKAGSEEARFSAQEAARRGAAALYKCPEITALALGCQLITWLSRAAALALVLLLLARSFKGLSDLLAPLALIERALEPAGVRLGLPLALAAAWLIGMAARALADAVSWGGFSHAATHKRAPDAATLWAAVERHLPGALLWGAARDLWLVALGMLAGFGYAALLWMQIRLADDTLIWRAGGGMVVALMYASGLVWGGLTLATAQLVPTVKVQRQISWPEALDQAMGLVGERLVSLYRLVGYGALALLPFVALVWACALLQVAASAQPEVLPALGLLSAGAQFLLLLALVVALTGMRAASFFWVAAIDGLWPTPPADQRRTLMGRLLGAIGLSGLPRSAEAEQPPASGFEALHPEATPNILSIKALVGERAAPAAPTSDEPEAG